VSEPAVFADAAALIRAGQLEQAVNLLQAALPDLPVEHHRKAHSYTGLACYFAGQWAEALGHFVIAANGSQIPEDHFNQAMTQVRLGDIEGAHASWQRVFDLSYAHQDAPQTSSFFEKKLMFAKLLRDAGACDARGLDLLERQLMGFYTNYRITDASYWLTRGVPAFEDVLQTTRDYYRAMGRTEAEWQALCDTISGRVDKEGQTVVEAMRAGYGLKSERVRR
jgi:tetratricopeptide (TPR) repeat protein